MTTIRASSAPAKVRIWAKQRLASLIPEIFSVSVTSGIKAVPSAPSPSSLRKILGKIMAKNQIVAVNPPPSACASRRIRINPRIRLANVANATPKLLLSNFVSLLLIAAPLPMRQKPLYQRSCRDKNRFQESLYRQYAKKTGFFPATVKRMPVSV